ncbi:MAG: D-alanyl-D-alanine carboxypeptidase [Nitrospirota bacterium]|nr:D-alanyl-D-alanine carboxypeptidase [Nitrospirota bacterium]
MILFGSVGLSGFLLTPSLSCAETKLSRSSLENSSGFLSGSTPFRTFRRARIPAESILLKDLSSGQVLYAFEADRRLSPASLTKIMSALVMLEYGKLDDYVTVSREAAAARKMHLRLRVGHIFRLEDLLKAMLITSANDACLAAAIHVGGSEEKFVELMNGKARALGLTHTHFSNACGFDSPTHYTTAQDLAALTELALQHPLFRSYVKEERGVLTAVNTNRSYLLRTTNRLLGRMPGVEGVKTGFTSKAGRCLIAKVSQDGKELLLVLLHASSRWNTAAHLIKYGLRNPHLAAAALR